MKFYVASVLMITTLSAGCKTRSHNNGASTSSTAGGTFMVARCESNGMSTLRLALKLREDGSQRPDRFVSANIGGEPVISAVPRTSNYVTEGIVRYPVTGDFRTQADDSESELNGQLLSIVTDSAVGGGKEKVAFEILSNKSKKIVKPVYENCTLENRSLMRAIPAATMFAACGKLMATADHEITSGALQIVAKDNPFTSQDNVRVFTYSPQNKVLLQRVKDIMAEASKKGLPVCVTAEWGRKAELLDPVNIFIQKESGI